MADDKKIVQIDGKLRCSESAANDCLKELQKLIDNNEISSICLTVLTKDGYVRIRHGGLYSEINFALDIAKRTVLRKTEI